MAVEKNESPRNEMPQREWSESDARVLARANANPVTKEELWQLAADSQKLQPEEHGAGAGAFLVAKRFHGEPDKAQAIHFRLEALAELLNKEGAPGWTLPALADGAVVTHEAVFAAAAGAMPTGKFV